MKVLAIDPGYDRVGAAVIERVSGTEVVCYSGCIETTTDTPFIDRLQQIGDEVVQLIEYYQPTALAIEQLFFTKNQKTAMGVAEARGMLLYIAGRAGLARYEYTPSQIKTAITGHGGSDKKQVMDMVGRLVQLPPGSRRDDEYDAIAVGLTCLAHIH